MHPIDFPERTGILKAAPGTEEYVQDLPYAQAIDPNTNLPYVVSCWELNKEERDMLLREGKIYISFVGNTIPPVLPTVEYPF